MKEGRKTKMFKFWLYSILFMFMNRFEMKIESWTRKLKLKLNYYTIWDFFPIRYPYDILPFVRKS